MKKLHLIFLCFIVAACMQKRTKNAVGFENMTRADSLEVVCALKASMWEEIISMYDAGYQTYIIEPSCGGWIEARNRMVVKANRKKQVMALSKLVSRDTITKMIYTYLTANLETNDGSNNYPLYGRTSKSEVKRILFHLQSSLTRMKKEQFPEEQLVFKQHEINKWQNKLKAMTVLKTDTIAEIYPSTSIEIDYPSDIVKSSYLLNPVLEAYLKLRNETAEKYLHESYVHLFIDHYSNKDTMAKEKLKAIEMLHPIKILDIPFMEKNGYRLPFSYRVPPPLNL